jgi:hypothetical protein
VTRLTDIRHHISTSAIYKQSQRSEWQLDANLDVETLKLYLYGQIWPNSGTNRTSEVPAILERTHV